MNATRMISSTALAFALAACAADATPTTEVTASRAEALGAVAPAAACAHAFAMKQGGRVLKSPYVENVFMGAYWGTPAGSSTVTEQTKTWALLASTTTFWKPVEEYSAITSSAAWSYTFASALAGFPPSTSSPSRVPEAAIRAQLSHQFDTLDLSPPTWNPDTIYVIYLPPGVASDEDVAHDWIGHHESFSYAYDNNTAYKLAPIDVVYAVVEYDADPEQMNRTVAHEIYEAVSNPTDTGWRDTVPDPTLNNQLDEIGDACNASTRLYGHDVVTTWSQKACGCVGPVDLPTPTTPTHCTATFSACKANGALPSVTCDQPARDLTLECRVPSDPASNWSTDCAREALFDYRVCWINVNGAACTGVLPFGSADETGCTGVPNGPIHKPVNGRCPVGSTRSCDLVKGHLVCVCLDD